MSNTSSQPRFLDQLHNTAQPSSLVWISAEQHEQKRHRAMLPAWIRLHGRHALLPWTFPEWIKHHQAMLEADLEHERHQLRRLQSRERAIPIRRAFDSKQFRDKRSSVLALPSIWIPEIDDHLPERLGGRVWPKADELHFEGEARKRTEGGRFGRCAPLVRDWPRVPAGTSFKHTPLLLPLAFDDMRPVPTAPDARSHEFGPGWEGNAFIPGASGWDPEDINYAVGCAKLGGEMLAALDA